MSGVDLAFGRLLKARRQFKGLSQGELAESLNLSRISVANFESGSQKVALSYLVKLSKILEFSLDDFCKSIDVGSIDNQISKLPISGDLRCNIEAALGKYNSSK